MMPRWLACTCAPSALTQSPSVVHAAAPNERAGKVFMRYARSYINLLRRHIAEEDGCHASAVALAFSSGERERLTHEFEEMERREIGERAFERFAAVVEALEGRDSEGSSADPSKSAPSQARRRTEGLTLRGIHLIESR